MRFQPLCVFRSAADLRHTGFDIHAGGQRRRGRARNMCFIIFGLDAIPVRSLGTIYAETGTPEHGRIMAMRGGYIGRQAMAAGIRVACSSCCCWSLR